MPIIVHIRRYQWILISVSADKLNGGNTYFRKRNHDVRECENAKYPGKLAKSSNSQPELVPLLLFAQEFMSNVLRYRGTEVSEGAHDHEYSAIDPRRGRRRCRRRCSGRRDAVRRHPRGTRRAGARPRHKLRNCGAARRRTAWPRHSSPAARRRRRPRRMAATVVAATAAGVPAAATAATGVAAVGVTAAAGMTPAGVAAAGAATPVGATAAGVPLGTASGVGATGGAPGGEPP